MSVTIKRKVFAYITSGATSGHRLLVFSHPLSPDAGIQVPAGTMRDAETPEVAVLREAHEETGLADLKIVRPLGRHEFDARPFGRAELHDRWFFHLICDAQTPERWVHDEADPSDAFGTRIPFELFWVAFPAGVPELIVGHDRFLPELIASLRS